MTKPIHAMIHTRFISNSCFLVQTDKTTFSRMHLLLEVNGNISTINLIDIIHALHDYPLTIKDINQQSLYESISLTILAETDASAIQIKQRLETLDSTLQVSCTESHTLKHDNPKTPESCQNYTLTLLAKKLSNKDLDLIFSLLTEQSLCISNIRRLSGENTGTGCADATETNDALCLEIKVTGTPVDQVALKTSFLQIAHEKGIDIAFQKDTALRRYRRLVVFDMDSTLIEAEVIDELAKQAGAGDKVAAITESAMRGEIDFNTSFEKRVRELEGLEAWKLEQVAEQLKLTDGVERLMLCLKRLGLKTAILSGGFTFFGEHLQRKLGFDYVFANTLDIKNNKVTGKVTPPIINGEQKALKLKAIAEKEGIQLEQVIAVGDGANDLPMLSAAGLGIAFRAKPIVSQTAEHALSTFGLDGILYLMGFSDADIDSLTC